MLACFRKQQNQLVSLLASTPRCPRFDFQCFQKVSKEEIIDVQNLPEWPERPESETHATQARSLGRCVEQVKCESAGVKLFIRVDVKSKTNIGGSLRTEQALSPV